VSRLWPVCEAAQADYEQLRAAALASLVPIGGLATRFETDGMIGLIRRPAATAVYTAVLHGARRAAWTPYCDPRLELLADAYELLLSAGADSAGADSAERAIAGGRS
jgi:hypothetical protein